MVSDLLYSSNLTSSSCTVKPFSFVDDQILMNKKQFIEELNLEGQRVLTRVDFNVPLNDELNITDNGRIKAALPTVNYIIENGGNTNIMEKWSFASDGNATDIGDMPAISSGVQGGSGGTGISSETEGFIGPLGPMNHSKTNVQRPLLFSLKLSINCR